MVVKNNRGGDVKNLIKQDLFQYIWNSGEENKTQERDSKDTGYYSMKHLSLLNNVPNLSQCCTKMDSEDKFGSILRGRGADVNGSYRATLWLLHDNPECLLTI